MKIMMMMKAILIMILNVPHSLSMFAPIVSFLFQLNAAPLQKYDERTTLNMTKKKLKYENRTYKI